MRRVLTALLPSALFLWSSCSGPSSDPGNTIESYYDEASDSDWESMVDHLAPETLKRIGSRAKMARYLEESFANWTDFDIDVEEVRLNTDEKTGTVKFQCTGQVFFHRDRKYHPGRCDDLWSVVKQDDGRWYIVLPESQRLRPML